MPIASSQRIEKSAAEKQFCSFFYEFRIKGGDIGKVHESLGGTLREWGKAKLGNL